jgi:hypothetical protein
MPVYANATASLLNTNFQRVVWNGETIAANSASTAVLLERQKSASYPFGAAFQIAFTTAPGTFDVEVQGSEDDTDATYVKLASITAVNSSNVGRYDMVAFYPKYVRLFVRTLTGSKVATAVITR